MSIKFPKRVSNKLTKRLGTANITTHKTTSNAINPTTKLRFFLENMLPNDIAIYIILYISKKIILKLLKKNAFIYNRKDYE